MGNSNADVRDYQWLGYLMVVLSGVALIGWTFFITREIVCLWALLCVAVGVSCVSHSTVKHRFRPLIEGISVFSINILVAVVVYYAHTVKVLWAMLLGAFIAGAI